MSYSYRIRQLCIVIVIVSTFWLLLNSLYAISSSNAGRSFSGEEVERLFDSNDTNVFDGEVIVFGEDGKKSVKSEGSFKLKGQGCRIPKLDINGSEVIHFFGKAEPLNCNKTASNWVFIDDQGFLQLLENRQNSKCLLKYFGRKNDLENSWLLEEPLATGTKMKYDFAKVNCIDEWAKWSGLLMSVAGKPIERKKSSQNALNVYFLSFDSVSHMTFMRKMKETHRTLEDMGAIVLNGYNIVGDGTPQAFIPILTGGTEDELPLTRKRFKNANYVDDVYPFIWKNFSENGYVTAYGEDAFNVGTFTYRLKGFRKQPTDHYLRTFFKEQEQSAARNCIGSQTLHQNWFRYAREFMKVYEDLPRFLLFHQGLLSHDYINLISVEDEDVAAHLRTMASEGWFDNAVVIVMADHGHRFAKLRNTHQGQLEERLPYFSITLPKSFKETVKGKIAFKNLMTNKDRLTSPFDIHATLMDVLNIPDEQELMKVETDANGQMRRSLSLFRPIPENRTCQDAGIAPHWCTCLSWVDAMKTKEDAAISMKLANTVVSIMNKQIQNVKDLCHPLKLKQLLSSKKLLPNDDLLKYKAASDADGFVADLSGTTSASFAHYQLKLSTTPGRAIYEITLFYDFKRKRVEVDLTSVSHISKYGDDPHCIIDKNFFLATYCVCYDKI